MLLQKPRGAHHFVEGSGAAFIVTISVVQLFGAINAQADEKTIVVKKPAPFFIEQHTIGLQCVFDLHSGLGIFFLYLHCPAEKIQSHEGRLTALPGDRHIGRPMSFNGLANILLHQFVRHTERAFGVHLLLLEIKAVGAIEIALGAGRLGHHMKRRQRILQCHRLPPSMRVRLSP